MDWKEMYRKSREFATKAAQTDDKAEYDELMEQAETWKRRGDAEKFSVGLGEIERKEEKAEPKADIKMTLADAGYGEQEIKQVVDALAGRPPAPATGDEKEYTFADFLIAERHGDTKALKAMGARKDMEEGSGVSGGYLVPTEQLAELLQVPDSDAVVRPRARRIPMRRRSITIPALDQGDAPDYYWDLDYYGGVYSKWTAEGGTKHETEPEFKQLELVAYKLAGYTQASDELLDDSAVALESLLKGLFRNAISLREDFAFLRGTGVGQPQGILNSGALIAESRDTANEINFGDLTEMYEHMLPSSLSNAYWVVSQTALAQLFEMQDPNDNYMWMPNERGGAAPGMPGTLLGRPVIVTEKLPTLGNEGDILFADFNYYLIGDRQATTIQSSEHYAFVNDLTTWRFVHRVDGQSWLDEPVYIDTTNQCSPFVTLAA